MIPDPSYLLSSINLSIPLIGVYDAPSIEPHQPVVFLPERQRACLFEFFPNWIIGETLVITKDNYGCGGCGTWWFNRQTRSRENYIDFLANKEGLKSNEELMGEWFDRVNRYVPAYEYLLVGPLKTSEYKYLKTITFYVNPDQLSVLLTGVQYNQAYTVQSPVTVDFGSGCMEMLTLFEGKKGPHAIIGATDMAMRNNLPPNLLALTVNKGMFENLCALNSESFLGKPFLKVLKQARGGQLG